MVIFIHAFVNVPPKYAFWQMFFLLLAFAFGMHQFIIYVDLTLVGVLIHIIYNIVVDDDFLK